MRSLLLHCTARETGGGIADQVIDAFAPFEGLALRHIEGVHEPIFDVFWGPNSATTEKVEKMVGYKIISSLLTRLTCPVYAFSRFKRTKSVHYRNDYYFLPLYVCTCILYFQVLLSNNIII